MSVYTLLNQNQLRDLLDFYQTDAIESISAISDGIENSNYLVKGWQQDYVLTILEQPVAKLDALFDFLEALDAADIAVPSPLRNKKGHRLSYFEYHHQRKAFVLCKKLAGAHPGTIDGDLCAQVGKAFANIHQLSSEPALCSPFAFEDLHFILPDSPLDFLGSNKQERFEQEKHFLLQVNDQCTDLPTGICHCDFFPDNCLFVDHAGTQQLSALLDWYDARHTYLLLDLAIIAVSWCSDRDTHKLNEERLDALLYAYQGVRMLNKRELGLWPAFLRIAAFQFWISREQYMARMKKEGRQARSDKQAEEFYSLLDNLVEDMT